MKLDRIVALHMGSNYGLLQCNAAEQELVADDSAELSLRNLRCACCGVHVKETPKYNG